MKIKNALLTVLLWFSLMPLVSLFTTFTFHAMANNNDNYNNSIENIIPFGLELNDVLDIKKNLDQIFDGNQSRDVKNIDRIIFGWENVFIAEKQKFNINDVDKSNSNFNLLIERIKEKNHQKFLNFQQNRLEGSIKKTHLISINVISRD
ncbi:MAG: hypothetical protein HQK49_17750 [Oligoflexia bacterium]|nr:hypothetical protein [Oligoflexia bacterium]